MTVIQLLSSASNLDLQKATAATLGPQTCPTSLVPAALSIDIFLWTERVMVQAFQPSPKSLTCAVRPHHRDLLTFHSLFLLKEVT